MPGHFFYGSVRIDFESAVRADVSRQNCSVCPRYWYVDATFGCAACGRSFSFSADEQRAWYEEYGFWVDSRPKNCVACRRELRNRKRLRQEYDSEVARAIESGDLECKKQLADVIDQLYEAGGELPGRINENRRRLARQIEKLAQRSE